MKSNFNIPNVLTTLRVLFVPVFIYLLFLPSFHARLAAVIIFAVASLTDLFDGYLARKWDQETEFGKFMDPLADKALVIGALITFTFLSEQVELWMVVCIIGRDFLITALRGMAIRQGGSLRTSMFGKIKTAFQMFSIVAILLSFLLVTFRERNAINQLYQDHKESSFGGGFELAISQLVDFLRGDYTSLFFSIASFLPYFLMLITVILTVVSGLRYLVSNRNYISYYFKSQRQE